MRTLLLALVFVFLASPALAADGVLEINQTCAVQTGCFSGDTAGYPVTVDGSAGRSYRLTSDLIVPDENTDGIRISTSSITVDLNGFEIVRSGCEGVTTNCTPASGTGSGLERTTSTLSGLSVRNGSITGMGLYGVRLGRQAEVTNVRVRWNRFYGIAAGSGSTISGNTAYQNGDAGIEAGSGSTVRGNTSFDNGDDGIFASFGSTVAGNTAYSNDGDGIQTSGGASVQRNTVRLNEGYGLNLSSQSAYRENVITNNVTGTVNGGVNMFSNSCNGTTTCP